MASSALLWLACVAGAACPPLLGCALAVFVSPSNSGFLLLLAGLSWSIQLLGWAWSAAHHSEQYYDLLGSLTFVSLTLVSLAYAVAGPSLYPTLLASFLPGLLSRAKTDSSLSSLWSHAASLNTRQMINSLLVLVWATRLGAHLFSRIRKSKKDARSAALEAAPCEAQQPRRARAALTVWLCVACCRFDRLRDSGAKLLLPWMTQGLWVFSLSLPVTLSNALLTADRSSSGLASAVVGSAYNPAAVDRLSPYDLLGWALWLAAFALEVVADRQKAAFSADQANKDKFIDVGLWRLSRHPNCPAAAATALTVLVPASSDLSCGCCSAGCCCVLLSDLGEMSMWFGLFLSCSCAFSRPWHYLSLAGPCFNAFLLLFVSGIPLLEASSDKKFGKSKAYQSYKERTPVLLPKLGALAGLLHNQATPSSDLNR